jgi:hypothetical protein
MHPSMPMNIEIYLSISLILQYNNDCSRGEKTNVFPSFIPRAEITEMDYNELKFP